MEKPNRSENKYWTGTHNFDELQFAEDLEEYIYELEQKLVNPIEPQVSWQWHKAENEMPKIHEYVLIKTPFCKYPMIVGYWRGDDWYDCDKEIIVRNVTDWMPLPLSS